MGFLSATTAIVAAGVTVPALLALHLLKLRRRRVVVSSTRLWSFAVSSDRANALFERLRRNLLLLLQLMVLSLLLLALARPTVRGVGGSDAAVILLLDHSASMNATDVTPTRLDRAKRLARRIVEHSVPGVAGGAGVMVISFAVDARIVQPFTGDRALLEEAIASIAPTDLPTKLAPALGVVEPFLRVSDAADGVRPPRVYVISDGGWSDAFELRSPPLALQFLKVGEDSDNVAITSLSARRLDGRPHGVGVLVRLVNFAPTPRQTNLTLKVNGHTERVVAVAMPPRTPDRVGEQAVRFELDHADGGLLEVSCDHTDALAVDNTAWLTLAPRRQPNVLLVSTGNPYLRHAIEAASVRRLVQATPRQYEEHPPRPRRHDDADGFDLVVFDRYQPRSAPNVNSLSFAAVVPIDRWSLEPTRPIHGGDHGVLNWRRGHPLLAHVALDDLRMARPFRFALPDSARTLAVGRFGPVMALVKRGRAQHVAVGFDLLESNWPLQVGFPIFVRNCVRWLGVQGGDAAALVVRSGLTPQLPLGPGGGLGRYVGDSVGEGPPFVRVGLYRASTATDPPFDRFGVNLLDELESDLEPGEPAGLTGGSSLEVHPASGVGRHEIWPWFAAAALVLLLVEWVVYTRHLHG